MTDKAIFPPTIADFLSVVLPSTVFLPPLNSAFKANYC